MSFWKCFLISVGVFISMLLSDYLEPEASGWLQNLLLSLVFIFVLSVLVFLFANCILVEST